MPRDIKILLAIIVMLAICNIFLAYCVRTLTPPQPMPNFNVFVAPEGKAIEVNSHWSFAVADYDRDGTPDLWVIKQANTGTGMTELHILSGRDPAKWLLQTGTALHETPNHIKF